MEVRPPRWRRCCTHLPEMIRRRGNKGWLSACAFAVLAASSRPALAQSGPASAPTATAAQTIPAYDPERRPDPNEPDFRLVNLPTTLRLPRHRANFTLTHRFAGNLRNGSFTDQLGDLFGLDRGANIGIEYRYAVMRHVQAVFFRTNIDKTIQFSARFNQIRQSDAMPVSITGVVSVEGSNNFRRRREPAIGAVVERSVGTRLALYVEPFWVHDTAAEAGLDMNTTFLGIGGRARIHNMIYVVAEVSPRLAGYTPGDALFAFAIEKRIGGHVFQLNFTNAPSTTFAQIARGGFPGSLSMGFNLSRKFF